MIDIDSAICIDTTSLQFLQDDIITLCKFHEDDFIPPKLDLDPSVFEDVHPSSQAANNGNSARSSVLHYKPFLM